MAAGLLQEAIMARGRRELASENGYDEAIPPPATRTRRGRSQNSRYENDLGNIASFDRPPVKPKVAPRSSTTVGSGDKTVASVNFTKYKYGGDPQDHVEIGGGKEQGGGGEGGVWRKLQAPEPKESLDPNLESILFPKPKPPPHSSSDSFFLKTPSSPHAPAPGPAPRNYNHSYNTPTSHSSSDHARRLEYQHEDTGFFQEDPGDLAPQAKLGNGRPAQSVGVLDQRVANGQQQGYAPPRHPDPLPPLHPSYNVQQAARSILPPYPTQAAVGGPSANGHYQQPPPPMPSFTPRMAPSYPPPQPNAYPPPIIPYPQLYPSYNQYQAISPAAPLPGQYIPQPPIYPPPTALTDPSTQPIPVYDHTIRQWVLLPAAPLLPLITDSAQAMSLSSASRNRSRSRQAADPCSGDIPEALEEAFQHIESPTRPRRAPSGVDMRAKKTGKALIRSLETQVEEASSSADELNLRPAYEERQRVQRRVDEVSDDRDFFDDDEAPPSPPVAPKTARTKPKSRAPPRRHDHAQPVEYEQPEYDFASQDESEDLPAQHYQPRARPRGSHFSDHIHQERRRDRSKQHRKRARVDYHSSEPTRSRRLPHSPPHHRHSLPSRHIKASHPLPPSRSNIPSHRRLRRQQPTRSPSDTETDSDSDPYNSAFESDSESGSFTSPSNTPSSPSPEAEPRVPLTAGAWAGYEIPDHLVHSETLPHPKRSRRSKRVKSVPLLPHQRPRDAHGKWLPYAYTRSESPEGGRAEMEVEDEPEEEGGREDIEAFSSPSQEDRGRAEREEMDIEENGEEMPPLPATKRGGKKSVRWDKGVKEYDAGRKGVNRLPKGWNVEEQAGDAEGQEGGNQESTAVAEIEEEGNEGKGAGGVSPFGEGFFDAATAGEVGFKVWRDEY